MQKMRQLEFGFPVGHGGARRGAGRIGNGTRKCVRHQARESFSKERVLHITCSTTCSIAAGLPSLRDPKTAVILFNYLLRVCKRAGFRIVEFSIQGQS